jgi:hypothetical protein
MALQVVTAKDRLGRDIVKGDLTTAEGEAHLQGRSAACRWISGSTNMRARWRAKRFADYLRDGRSSATIDAVQKMSGNIDGDAVQRWHVPAIYEHCLAGHILGKQSLFERDPQEVSLTTRAA